MGPDYKRPIVTVPDAYRGAAAPESAAADAVSIGDQAWWDVFQDDQLRELIRTALQQNLDLRIAATRILEAQAQLGITRADQFPTVDAGASTSRTRVAKSVVPFPLDAVPVSDFQLTASAAWEIDFWGKYRRATEAARASLLASEWGRRAVVTTLVSQVASAYFEMRAFDLQLDIATRTLASRRESLRLTEVTTRGGATSLVDVRQAEQLVFNAAATIADLERQIAQQENYISVLLGSNPVGRSARRLAGTADAPSRRSSWPAIGAPRTAAGHPAGRTAADRRQREHRRRQGGVLSADRVDGKRRGRERGAVGPVHDAGGSLVHRRRADAADLQRRTHSIARRAVEGAAGGGGARLPADDPAVAA